MEDELDEWLVGRPPAVIALAKQYPAWTSVVLKELGLCWVCGYREMDDEVWLIVSPINPEVDYDRAQASRVVVCPKCLDGPHQHTIPIPPNRR